MNQTDFWFWLPVVASFKRACVMNQLKRNLGVNLLSSFWAILFVGGSTWLNQIFWVLHIFSFIALQKPVLGRNRLVFNSRQHLKTVVVQYLRLMSQECYLNWLLIPGMMFGVTLFEHSLSEWDNYFDPIGGPAWVDKCISHDPNPCQCLILASLIPVIKEIQLWLKWMLKDCFLYL